MENLKILKDYLEKVFDITFDDLDDVAEFMTEDFEKHKEDIKEYLK